jgi:hypothetical protein
MQLHATSQVDSYSMGSRLKAQGSRLLLLSNKGYSLNNLYPAATIREKVLITNLDDGAGLEWTVV